MSATKGAIFRLILGLIAGFAIWLRWMYVFASSLAPVGRLVTGVYDEIGKRPLYIAAAIGILIVLWTAIDALTREEGARRRGAMALWLVLSVVVHLAVVIVTTVFVATAADWFGLRVGGGRYRSVDILLLVASFVAFLIGVPLTIAAVALITAMIARRRNGVPIVAAADATSSVLVILLVAWTLTVGWKWPERSITSAESQRIAQQQGEQARAAAVKESNRDSDGSRLIEASTYGDARLVRMLLEYGSPVNARGMRGFTPLIAAVAALPAPGAPPSPGNLDQRVEIIEMLLKAGASVNATDTDGFTALDYAVNRGVDRISDQLVAAGGKSRKNL